MTRVEKTVFISYWHTNAFLARAIFQSLTHNGFDVFTDDQEITSGDFERVLLENMRARAHFLVILTPSALKTCDTPRDWFRRKIEEAVEFKRNIVPLMLEGFDFSAPAIETKLTGILTVLKQYEDLTVSAEYFDAAMTTLRERFLNVPLDMVLYPASSFAKQVAKDQQTAAATALPVQPRQLTAQKLFEKGVDAGDPDEQIRCYTEVIRLNPDETHAYRNRAFARHAKGNFDGAMEDFTTALELGLKEAIVYCNRGVARHAKGDLDGAIADYTTALKVDTDNAEAYYNRGLARHSKGDLDGTLEDFTTAIRLKPDWMEAYNNRGTVRRTKGDLDGAQEDFSTALRLSTDCADAFNNQGRAHTNTGDFDSTREALTTEATYNRIIGFLLVAFIRLTGLAMFIWFTSENKPTSVLWFLPLIILVFFLGFCGEKAKIFYRRARQYDAISTEDAIEQDLRPPLLYFRSFKDDEAGSAMHDVAGTPDGGGIVVYRTEEEQIVEALNIIGPVYAIGAPGERLPPVGAKRIYIPPDKNWKEVVTTYLQSAHAVVMRAGHTEGFWWEFQQTLQLIPPQRILILIPFTVKEYAEFRTRAEQYLPCGLPNYNGEAGVYGSLTGCIMFNENWTAHFQKMKRRISYHNPLVRILKKMCAPFFEHCRQSGTSGIRTVQ